VARGQSETQKVKSTLSAVRTRVMERLCPWLHATGLICVPSALSGDLPHTQAGGRAWPAPDLVTRNGLVGPVLGPINVEAQNACAEFNWRMFVLPAHTL